MSGKGSVVGVKRGRYLSPKSIMDGSRAKLMKIVKSEVINYYYLIGKLPDKQLVQKEIQLNSLKYLLNKIGIKNIERHPLYSEKVHSENKHMDWWRRLKQIEKSELVWMYYTTSLEKFRPCAPEIENMYWSEVLRIQKSII